MKTYIISNNYSVLLVILLCVVMGYIVYVSKDVSVVPSSLPEESNRIFSDNNGHNRFSIICPSGWTTTAGDDYITSYSRDNITNSSMAWGRMNIMGDISLDQEDIEKIQTLPTMTFQDTIAYIENEITPPRKMLGPSGYSYKISFERNKKWYFLSYFTNRKQKQFPPPIILEYFNTFRLENNTENTEENY